MSKDENGYIVLETIGTFIPFVFLILSILTLVNIVTLQARVHYALTQAAETISIYCYTLEVTGVAQDLGVMNSRAARAGETISSIQDNMNTVINGIDNFPSGSTGEAMNNLLNTGEDIADDPKSVIQDMMNYGLRASASSAYGDLVRSLLNRYLANGNMTGDEYLLSVNVIGGLDGIQISGGPDGSVLINKDGAVELVAQYSIAYKFGALPLPFPKPELKVTQTVETQAWLNGHGKGYW